MPSDHSACYIGDLIHLAGATSGPLHGLTAAVKDSYDIAGYLTSNGSPAWRETHPPAATTAPAVQALLDAGATIVGKTAMAELAFSLSGINAHYGTPLNPACSGPRLRDPGGSSSGSASAVAAGDVDFALGGDTGGSVRIPASFCGIYGIRPTHGRVDISGSCALAPSFDTGGWFARDPAILGRVGAVLLRSTKPGSKGGSQNSISFQRWLTPTDAFDLCDKDTTQAIYSVLSSKFDQVKHVLGDPINVTLGRNPTGGEPTVGSLKDWVDIFRTIQGYEAWQEHGEWLSKTKPALGPGVKDRFEAASSVPIERVAGAASQRAAITAHIEKLLGSDGVLTIPTAPGPALLLDADPATVDEFRGRMLSLTCIAGLSGLPEVTVPVGRVEGCPLGLSLVGPRDSDEHLIALARRLAHILDLDDA